MEPIQSPALASSEPTDSGKRTKRITLFLKILLSLLAVSYLIWRVDWAAVGTVMSHVRAGWLFLAYLTYNLSQLTSTFRLRTMLSAVDIVAPPTYLIPLYYTGMAYNLFLPGGIGGDGYKVVKLRTDYGVSYRLLVTTLLLDRLLGLLAIGVLACLVASLNQPVQDLLVLPAWVFVGAAVIGYGLAHGTAHAVFPRFRRVFLPGFALALVVQSLQLVACSWLLLALGVTSQFVNYWLTFLLSSVATAVPLTVGGVGMRELTFVEMSHWLPIQTADALATSLLLFLIGVVSALPGFWLGAKKSMPMVKEA